MLKIFFTLSALALGMMFPCAVRAESKIEVNPASGIFSVTNAVPGGVYDSEIASVINIGTAVENIGFKVLINSGSSEILEKLYLGLKDLSGDCLWGCGLD
jgi:hypothetical protein